MPRVDRSAPASLSDVGARSSNSPVATVRLGETKLSDIARRLGVDPNALRQANPNISDSTRLKAGQEIRLAQIQAPQAQASELAPVGGGRPAASGLAPAPLGDPMAKSAMEATLNAKTAGRATLAHATDRDPRRVGR